VLEAVKARPGNAGVRRYGRVTADLDSFCARRRRKSAVGAEECSRRGSNQRMDPTEQKHASIRTTSGPSSEAALKATRHGLLRPLSAVYTRVLIAVHNPPRLRCTERYPRIREAVAAIQAASAVIDGEAVCCDGSGVAIFDQLHSRAFDDLVFLYAFDLLELDGVDWRPRPLKERKAKLEFMQSWAGAARYVAAVIWSPPPPAGLRHGEQHEPPSAGSLSLINSIRRRSSGNLTP
jgi:hypothetical protein